MIIKKEQDQIIGYLEDASNLKGGRANVLYIPETEEEIVQAVRECVKNKTPITVSGGGTGTVGARIAKEGAILSTEKLSGIIGIDKTSKTAILRSGVIIDNFLKAAEKENLFYPPFPTERTAFIGGNVSTNASGEYSYRFGSTRRHIKKIRAVLSNGEVIEIKRGKYCADKDGCIKAFYLNFKIPSYTSPCVKNSAGYFSQPKMDLIDLFIGSEGTLGIISQVETELISSLKERFIMILFFEKEEEFLALLEKIKSGKKVRPLSVEYFDKASLEFVKKDFPGIPDCSCALYVEDEKTGNKLDQWLELTENYNVRDTWISKDEKSYRNLIDFRHKLPENINEYFKKIGSVKLAIDASLPEKAFPCYS